MHGGDGGGKLYFLLLKLIKRKKKSPVLGEASQLILSPIVAFYDDLEVSDNIFQIGHILGRMGLRGFHRMMWKLLIGNIRAPKCDFNHHHHKTS